MPEGHTVALSAARDGAQILSEVEKGQGAQCPSRVGTRVSDP